MEDSGSEKQDSKPNSNLLKKGNNPISNLGQYLAETHIDSNSNHLHLQQMFPDLKS